MRVNDMKKRVAVLGAGGFVGGHVLRFLRANGYEARAVVRRPPSTADPDWRIADACDVYALRDAFAGCEYVLHAALGDNRTITDSVAPVYTAAEAVGARRLIYMSSGSVHGQSPAPGTDETSTLSVRQAFPYNNAKVRAERKLKRLRARGTVELVILRPTIVFGPGSRWVYDFGDGLQTHTAYVVDGAAGFCNSIYVDNLSYAVTRALTAPNIDGEVFLLGDEEVVRWSDLYRPIAQAFGADFDAVPSLSPAARRPTATQRYIDPLLASDVTRAIRKAIPRGAKDAVKLALRQIRRGASRAEAAAPPVASVRVPAAPTAADVPAEIADLHRCRWRLPHDKAVRMLGYVPPVSFDEGVQRSIEWLERRYAQSRLAS
jgi:nucleoside-diphosphate-sugar epimerase